MVINMKKVSEIFAGSPARVDPRKIEKATQKAFVTVQQAAAQQRELFAERLKTLRNNAGLTQAQLAEKSGIHPALITRYETAGAMPRQKAIEKLAAALDVAPDVFSCLCSTLGKSTEARLIIESVVTLSTLEESLLKIKEFKKLIKNLNGFAVGNYYIKFQEDNND